jgi:GNAT superfamily N-acetyltransferase
MNTPGPWFGTKPLPAAGSTIRLRPEQDRDAEFLLRLYLSVRWHELQAIDWPDESKRAFFASQFSLQRQQYRESYPGLLRWIVERAAEPVGRLYLLSAAGQIRVVDLSRLESWRGQGIGTVLLKRLRTNAEAQCKPLRLSVLQENPAWHLYRRLGFQNLSSSGPYQQMEYRAVPLVTD